MVSELARPFDMSRIAVSKHLRVLEQAKLIERSVDGRVHRCTLVAAPLLDAQQWLDQYQEFWSGSLQSLAHYARAKKSGARR